AEEYNIIRAPLSEYLLFLWMENSLMSKDSFDFTPLLKILSASELSKYLTPFEKLKSIANKHLSHVNGGNIRYRFAKIIAACEFSDAVIATGPRYENGQMIMDMRNITQLTEKPLLQLAFDGDWDREAEERLEAFLYYVDK
ncbi:MAG: hypothetical protein K6G51_01890, partial [Sphaerochaetaceae bacterium]|nr:hypothetical protein [Sphaerochaetaceae bacterium]